MSAAMAAPTAAAARNPIRTLSTKRAVPNPVIAESMMEPSKLRLMTPAFSLMVSPIVAYINGPDAAIIEARLAVVKTSPHAAQNSVQVAPSITPVPFS